jgi:hypothetical protein
LHRIPSFAYVSATSRDRESTAAFETE